MGNLLETPITEKETHSGVTDTFEWGVSSMQGWRIEMEDGHVCAAQLEIQQPTPGKPSNDVHNDSTLPLKGHSLFGVLDGHGGTFSAKYASQHFARVLCRNNKFVRYGKRFLDDKYDNEQEQLELLKEALNECFITLDREIYLEVQKGTPFKDKKKKDSESDNNNDDDAAAGGGTTILEADGGGTTILEEETLQISDPQQAEEDSGTTVCLVLVTPTWIICANAGDSRAVLARASGGEEEESTRQVSSLPLSFDHKPDNFQEEERIRKAGGFVSDGRVNGDLAVSRSLGDFRFKHISTVLGQEQEQHNDDDASSELFTSLGHKLNQDLKMTPEMQPVSPVPDILVQNRDKSKDLFLVCACDGIWDVQTNEECCKTVADIFAEGESNIGLVCEELLDYSLEIGSKDNMTALVLKFPAQEIGEGKGVGARRALREAATD